MIVTAPRQIIPGSFYFVTRRCTQRQFLLRPDPATTAIVVFCLAEAAYKLGIDLLAWHVASNHYHAVVYDPCGNLPAFLERFHKFAAKTLNERWDRGENLWSSEPTCVVRLVDLQDVFDKVIYTLTNAITDDLVDRVFDWPGASSLRHMGGRPISIDRPRLFFRKRGPIAASVTLSPVAPAGWPGGADAWNACVRDSVHKAEHAARERRLTSGTKVVGRRNVLRAAPSDRAMTPEPRRQLRPSIACKDPERRALALLLLREFRSAYARARARFVRLERDVVFPLGTYLMRLVYGVRCAVPL
jgi:REP element-mobilizing transposase RayT